MVFLVAAMSLLQVGSGFAESLANSAAAPAATVAGDCCDTSGERNCDSLVPSEAAASCARHCAQLPGAVPSKSGLLAPSFPACGSASQTGIINYSVRPPRLRAAPPAISSTPLIYHLQRLLN